MRIALVRPNANIEMFKIHSESLALGYLAAILRKHSFDTDIIDAYLENLTIEDVTRKILQGNYSIVGFTICDAYSLEWTIKICSIIKEASPNVHIVLGGNIVSFEYEQILRDVLSIDSIVRFEGEYILLDLAIEIQSGRDWREVKGLVFRSETKNFSNDRRLLIANLDELPFPHRDYLPFLIEKYPDEYSIYVNRGRGCYRQCKFCSVPAFSSIGQRSILRQRSNEVVLNEINHVVNTYNARYFTFVDDVFSYPSQKGKMNTIAFAKAIHEHMGKIYFSICERIDNIDEEVIDVLISAGLIKVFIGLEAASQDILNKLDKAISCKYVEKTMNWLLQKNIDVEVSFINFLPFNTLENIKENVEFFSGWGLDILRSLGNRFQPYPGSALYHELAMEGNLKSNGFTYDFINNVKDSRVDKLYAIVEEAIPYWGLLSYKLRSAKTIFWRGAPFLKHRERFRGCLMSMQEKIMCEIKEIFLTVIVELQNKRAIDLSALKKEVYKSTTKIVEYWLSRLLELTNNMRKEIACGKADIASEQRPFN